MVVVHLPPPLRSITPELVTLDRNDVLLRIFDPTKYDSTAVSFRNYGPVSRFDHHRQYSNKIDSERSVIYAAPTLSCCLVEIFGDGGVIRIEQQQLAFITLKDTLKLLDLRGSGAMAAGTLAALSSITERNISQAWGRYFYENPQLYGEIDGLIFTGAHNGEDAVCFYERAKTKMASAKVEVLNLNHPDLRDTILSIAKNHSLIVNPY
ncbi:RES domain-containing protein [Waterburya agarophytonicola K14]|uniref:RES domain-containing protein n=1 Tax=Waterburya agarophytonicola KI4 TaxID=2874699 RepID=A0A964FM56_9CYAN|nr:RES domain-containing protein [Waterburya agarophytonicola]MCC0179728.1 RES domain-containing protein [Waterburya agarophytonicola KI4]